jgi:hypothetical protein
MFDMLKDVLCVVAVCFQKFPVTIPLRYAWPMRGSAVSNLGCLNLGVTHIVGRVLIGRYYFLFRTDPYDLTNFGTFPVFLPHHCHKIIMADKKQNKQINQMCNFILQEAREKAREIRIKVWICLMF